MNVSCHPIPQPLVEEMLQLVARALCARPAETVAQGASRTRQMVHSTMGFEPRDGIEYMFSTLVYGHFELILDSMRDVLTGQAGALKAKARTAIVALDRSMLALIKEFGMQRRRPLGNDAREARPATSPAVTPTAAATPPSPTGLASNGHDSTELSPTGLAAAKPSFTRTAMPATSDRALESLATMQGAAGSGPIRMAASPVVAPVTRDRPRAEALSPGMSHAESGKSGVAATSVAPLPPLDDDEATFARHIGESETAMAAATVTLAEARALYDATAAAEAAPKD
jgi:hypothetical protein